MLCGVIPRSVLVGLSCVWVSICVSRATLTRTAALSTELSELSKLCWTSVVPSVGFVRATGTMVLVHPIVSGDVVHLPCAYGYASTIRAQGASLD